MGFPLIPDSLFSSALQVRGEALARAGIRLLLADLDSRSSGHFWAGSGGGFTLGSPPRMSC